MFKQARLKLTAWYLLIIMLISIAFSVAIFQVLTSELSRVERIQRLRLEHQSIEFFQRSPKALIIDDEVIEETKLRLELILLFINLGILGIAGLAGYFLAGRTLEPIKAMLDEQNRFIADSSHELRTPLTSLKSEMEVNLRDKNLTAANAKKLIASNLEEVNKLQLLSDSLIKLTQYQSGSHLVFEKIPLKPIIDSACKKVSATARAKGIKISNKIDDCLIEAEKNSIEELFVILLDNAVKYSLAEGKVVVTSDKKDGQVEIRIKDNGIGISLVDVPHIFDRFYRGDKSRTKSGVPGYGLGLSIAKQIVDRNHGVISVSSRLNAGTTFKLSLRLAE